MTSPTFGVGPGSIILDPNWEGTVGEACRSTLSVMGKEVESLARSYVPVDTGELKDSISSQVVGSGEDIGLLVSAHAEHADFVEYGTGGRGRQTQNTSPYAPRSFLASLRTAGYRHGPSKGMQAQPYLRPAMYTTARSWFGGV